jgi:Ca2+-binding EF-hand superfamily protein
MGARAPFLSASGVTPDAKEKEMKLTLVLTSLAAFAMTAPVLAQDAAAPAAPAPSATESADSPRPAGRHGRMLQRFDTDGNGTISLEEFSDMRMGDLLNADADNDGELSVAEIKAAMEKRREERMAEMFKRRFDVDGDGKITVAEIKDRQEKRFALADANNDGQISREEFAKMRGMMGGRHGGREGKGRHHGWSDN